MAPARRNHRERLGVDGGVEDGVDPVVRVVGDEYGSAGDGGVGDVRGCWVCGERGQVCAVVEGAAVVEGGVGESVLAADVGE